MLWKCRCSVSITTDGENVYVIGGVELNKLKEQNDELFVNRVIMINPDNGQTIEMKINKLKEISQQHTCAILTDHPVHRKGILCISAQGQISRTEFLPLKSTEKSLNWIIMARTIITYAKCLMFNLGNKNVFVLDNFKNHLYKFSYANDRFEFAGNLNLTDKKRGTVTIIPLKYVQKYC